eukprot:scaffold17687_cov51-Attheya_sp.AAC.1
MNNHDDGTLGMETGVSHHQGPVAGSEHNSIRPLLAKRRMNDRDGMTVVIVIQDQFLFPTGVPGRSLIPMATPSMNNHNDGTLGMETGVSHHPGPVLAGSEHNLIRLLLAKRRMNDRDGTPVVIVNLMTSGMPNRRIMSTATPRMNSHNDGTLGVETGV